MVYVEHVAVIYMGYDENAWQYRVDTTCVDQPNDGLLIFSLNPVFYYT
jgi:hypothetical protein